MPSTLDPKLKRALAERVRYYNDLGIYDFYRRALRSPSEPRAIADVVSEVQEFEDPMPKRRPAVLSPGDAVLEASLSRPEFDITDPIEALKVIREDLGDCTRCVLHKQGRKQIVFGVGNPHAELMFVGEAPGADEDIKGEPFVGRGGQLLNNMIKAMGVERERVYIANIIKCRPPNNRTPERDECEVCSPFLMRQIAAIKPKVIVALGAVAAKSLLAMNDSMSNLRGRWYDFRPAGVRSNDPEWSGAKLAVTYHPAFLLRDPRQKKEAWKDLQMVMKELGLKIPAKDGPA
jgi:uracil-DNA glycosylase family 4